MDATEFSFTIPLFEQRAVEERAAIAASSMDKLREDHLRKEVMAILLLQSILEQFAADVFEVFQ